VPDNQWFDTPFLRAIWKHTVSMLAILASWWILVHAVEFLVADANVRAFIESSDTVVIVAIFLYLPVRVVYDLLEGLKDGTQDK
jgi:hypothetical protein